MSSELPGVDYGVDGNQRLLLYGQPIARHHGVQKLDRGLPCLISLTQAPRVERLLQQHVSQFVPDARMPQNTTEYPPLKVGFRKKLQDTDTLQVDLAQTTAQEN